jgi:hypothetical protein
VPSTLTFCEDGLTRRAPGLRKTLQNAGHVVRVEECFDRCEQCEVRLLVRIDSYFAAFKTPAELLAALEDLEE